jgi:hypothetical protein
MRYRLLLCCRVLVHYRFDSVQGADGHLSQLLMLKLYKEYPDSAFAVWQQQQVRMSDEREASKDSAQPHAGCIVFTRLRRQADGAWLACLPG